MQRKCLSNKLRKDICWMHVRNASFIATEHFQWIRYLHGMSKNAHRITNNRANKTAAELPLLVKQVSESVETA